MPLPPRLVLASASPRREALLRRLAAGFTILASGAEEGTAAQPSRAFPPLQLPAPFAVPPPDHPVLWAWRKALAVAPSATADGRDALILGADTIVVHDGDVLQKPADLEDARQMLQRLSGRTHLVITGWAFVYARPGADAREAAVTQYGYVRSAVRMHANDADRIAWYVGTGEPLDKAGAYAVQGQGGALVARVDGCYTNVVGLPLCAVRTALAALGWPVRRGVDWHPDCAGPYCTPPQSAWIAEEAGA